ncbi:MAG TPA: hypothetical protein VNW30_08200 [Opitutaceae bacterium]|nr:hypothetical protein [Opitutaceae bacterium]
MPFFEICLTALLALWALGSGLYLLRVPRLHRWLVRMNRGLWFVDWGVFLASDPSKRAGTFELVFRDRRPDEREAPWRTAATGHCWSWRASVWLPERYRAAAIQNLGRRIKLRLARTSPASPLVSRDARRLGDYLARLCPAPAGTMREVRLVRRFPSGVVPDDEVLIFSRPAHAAGE